MKECNYCIYYQLKNKAKTIEVKSKPMKYFPLGVDIIVDGKWVCWFGVLPNHCEC